MTMINVNEHGAVSLNGEIIGWVRHDDGPQENDTWAQAVAAGLRWHAIPRGPVGLPQAHHVTFGQAVDALVAIRACDCPEDATGPWDCMDCPVHGAEAEAEVAAQQKSEMDAENAWLRAAENAGWDDDPRGY